MEIGGDLIPFEVKYHSQMNHVRNVQGLIQLQHQKESIQRGYILTKSPQDLGPLDAQIAPWVMQIPTSIFCYWLGKSEILQKNILLNASFG